MHEGRLVLRRAAIFVLIVLLVTAVAVRALALSSYFPALLIHNTHDGASYIAAARKGLLWTGDEPSGYPLFLGVVHAISHALWVTIALQHALGIAAGALLLLAVRRLGAPVALALLPAAVVWLNGDELFLEQAPLSETLFTFFLAVSVYAAVRTLEPAASRRWPVLLGASLTGLLVTRTVGAPLAIVVLAGLSVAAWRLRLSWRQPVLAAVSLVVAVGVYSGATHVATGRWSPLAGNTGWNLYMRAAEFADCSTFTPPPGTRALCQRTPSGKRPGPGYYRWLGGPAIRTYGLNQADHRVRAFALAAITHQPGTYLKLDLTDFVRYLVPGFGPRRYGDYGGPSTVAFPLGRPALDPASAREVRAYYGPGSVPKPAASSLLHDYQRYVRVGGPMLLLAAILAIAGSLVASGRSRWFLLLMIAVALELTLVPTLSGATWRYAIPAEGPLACAAAVAGWRLTAWARPRAGTGQHPGRRSPRSRAKSITIAHCTTHAGAGNDSGGAVEART